MNIQSTTAFSSIRRNTAPKGIVSAIPRKTSQHLPNGAQGKLVDAAMIAQKMGHPINRVTTIRTEILARQTYGVFAGKHEADGVSCLLELMRKWHIKRGIPWAAIWSREVGDAVGGHLHLGTHQSDEHTEAYINQLADWTGEERIYPQKHKPGNIGISEHGSWLVQCCMRRGESGTDVAAYIGKGEPTVTISAWRVLRPNKHKRSNRHPFRSGTIEGTRGTAYRHGTSRKIAPASKVGKSILAKTSDAERLISGLDWLPY